ncbi:AAA family ATPase [Tepidibacter hydrothermalis]|uniref:AAA family ATPase n=1 Tax=Tepidibacter hydrothermalis TaxID=3036126 RepID=A0ABY8EIT4_9FIRM|nr:AAA family ATPase [Tepidibacter hydrothermalis]WFD10860.1 AAA family ATPase [Tepidibacter hydrothermalis]
MQKNKIIAVWGNHNSGKTTLAAKIANELSKKKKNVILVLCDNITPTVSTILPLTDAKNQSLGELLSSIQITQESILQKCITLGKNDYLSVIGYLHGENERTYAKYSKERVVDLFILLKHLADYIIIDCSSLVSYDILSRTALELADQVIRLISPDLKAISFYDSCLPQFAERKYNLQNHMKVLSNVKYTMPTDSVANRFGGVPLEIPFIEEIEKQYLEGRLFESLADKKSQDYVKAINEIIAIIEGAKELPEKVKEKRQFNNPLKGFKWMRGAK